MLTPGAPGEQEGQAFGSCNRYNPAMELQHFNNDGDLEAFLARPDPGIILKHSTRCEISAEALRELESFARARPDVAAAVILVIENRPLSNALAARLGIPHQSPQAILVKSGAALWHANHWGITLQSLQSALADNSLLQKPAPRYT